jgi:hypothetical protein
VRRVVGDELSLPLDRDEAGHPVARALHERPDPVVKPDPGAGMEEPGRLVPQPDGAVIRLKEGRGPLDRPLEEHGYVQLAGQLG